MRLRMLAAVWRKELLETIRDRRTLVTTLLIPTLVMPLLMFGFAFVAGKIAGRAMEDRQDIMVIHSDESPALHGELMASDKLRVQELSASWRQDVSDKKVRAVVEFPVGFGRALAGEGSREGSEAVRIYHYEGEMRSGIAVREIRRVLGDYRSELVASRLSERGLPRSLLRPYEIETQNVAPPEKVGGNLIGGVIPYMFILLCMSGALYPAIDLTAGEKERGTMETLLCSPARRVELALGKILAVFTAAIATVLCSLLSMGGSFLIAGMAFADKFSGFGASAAKGAPAAMHVIEPFGLLMILVLALPMAFMFASLLLALALNGRTTKEAQSTCSPMIIVAIMPAMMGMMPGVDLSPSLAVVPVLNLALVSKELLSGVWHWGLISLVFSSSLLYAGAAIAWCVHQFNREAVIFRG